MRKGRPSITHLFFFLDDLIHFCEAYLNQPQVVKKCLNDFCANSGQKVSRERIEIFFSKNINHNRSREINMELGFGRTLDLLYIPLLHKGVTIHSLIF